jgi:tetratricopeptide (TPR) repeat protein
MGVKSDANEDTAMKRFLSLAVVFGLVIMAAGSPAAAQKLAACGCYCGKVISPPCSDNACKQACGWRAPSPGSSQPNQPYYDPNAAAAANEAAVAAEAERQRQQQEADRKRQHDAEEQRLRDEEAARQRQAEFERKKQEALQSMRGISENELGLKGTDAGDLGLRDVGVTSIGLRDHISNLPPACTWGDLNASVVDLRCLGLNPDKFIVIDPHIVRGHERVFPAQIDPTIFEDPNYKKAMEAEMHFDLASSAAAVQYFKQALLSHPNDPLVRNALLLAQDILAERTQRQQQADEQSELAVLHSLVDLMNGDLDAANKHVKQAGEIAPANEDISDLALSIGVMSSNFKNASVPTRDLKTVEKLVGNAYLAEGWGHYRAEIKFMEKAKQLDRNDAYVAAMLAHARYLSSKYPGLAPTTLAPK